MYLDYKNPDSIVRNGRLVRKTLIGLRDSLRRGDRSHDIADDDDGLPVRLISNADGELWFGIGDVGYDTQHGSACESCTVNPNDDDAAIEEMARDLVHGVANQLDELEES